MQLQHYETERTCLHWATILVAPAAVEHGIYASGQQELMVEVAVGDQRGHLRILVLYFRGLWWSFPQRFAIAPLTAYP